MATGAPRIEITIAKGTRADSTTGMAYVALSRDNKRSPIEQASATGSPLFSTYVEDARPGTPIVIGPAERGHPVTSLKDIPAGEYWIQPFVNVYTRFQRADGKTVWLHMDQWEGQDWKRSPGNLYGEPARVTFDPGSKTPVRLVVDKVIPPIQPPADTARVKRIKIESKLLSKWWGHPIHLGATVLLPKDYEKHPAVRYPVNYEQGHFSVRAPGGFGAGGAFDTFWLAADTPRMIYVTLQHPSPYYDDSYGVNSENNGPFGDAIMQELIPAIESTFRVIREPWARMLSGGSTGGWIAAAHQLFYPDFYGGVFASCPDAVDFRYHQIVNIYDDPNAYYLDKGWMKVPRPNQQQADGNIQSMMNDENHYELVVGDKSRSGGQWDIWEATYSPVGADGYPKRLWDKTTGQIDRTVAAEWRRYDLRHILETNWARLGPKVGHKLNVYVGDMDSVLLEQRGREAERVPEKGRQPQVHRRDRLRAPCAALLGSTSAELMTKMVRQIEKYAPPGADVKSWRY